MSKVLMVYYSRSGDTRRIAEEAARAGGWDLAEIKDRRRRAGPWGYLRSGYEALKRKTPDITYSGGDPSSYDLVVLGTPVWASSLASPMRSFVARHQQHLQRIALLCTYGGRGADAVALQVEQVLGHKPVAILNLTQAEIAASQYQAAIKRFVESVNRTAEIR